MNASRMVGARKISAVDYDLTHLKVPMFSQLMASRPLNIHCDGNMLHSFMSRNNFNSYDSTNCWMS